MNGAPATVNEATADGDSAHKNAGTHMIGTLLAVTCGLVLIRSAMFHLSNPFGFLATVYSYDLLPRTGGIMVAAILPATQLVLGLLLVLFARHRKFCLKISAVLFLLLAVVQVVTKYRGLNISCGCFGPSLDENSINAYSIGLAVACSLIAFLANWMTTDEQDQPTQS